MDGGDRAGYKQISGAVDTVLIGPSTGSTAETTGDFFRVRVISTYAVFAGITSPSMTGSSKITSATSWINGTIIETAQMTAIKLSSDSTGHAVMAYKRVLL